MKTIWDGAKDKILKVKEVTIETTEGDLTINLEKEEIIDNRGRVPLADEWSYYDTIEAIAEKLLSSIPDEI